MSMGDGSDGARSEENEATAAGEETETDRSEDARAADPSPDSPPTALDEEDEVLFAEVEEDDVTSVEDALRERIAELEEQASSTYQRMLRVAADYENFKRRTEREKEEIRKYGVERLLLDILPVLDNLERAVSHSAVSEDKKSLVDGVGMVQKQLQQALAKYGCESFDSVGLPFDPQKHEAVQQVESDEHEPNTVVEEYHRGYFLNERLIRPAMVVVSRRSAASPSEEPEPDGEEPPIAVDSGGEAHEQSNDVP